MPTYHLLTLPKRQMLHFPLASSVNELKTRKQLIVVKMLSQVSEITLQSPFSRSGTVK